MAPLPIIEHLNVFKDLLPRLLTGRITPMVHQLTLERPEETFHTGVIPTVAFAAHAGRDPVELEESANGLSVPYECL